MADELLKQAIKVIRAGNKQQGRELIAEILKTDRDNEQAWLWLIQANTTREEKIKALKQVLRINPHNETAKKKLTQLEKSKRTSGLILALVITAVVCSAIGSLTNPPTERAPTPTPDLSSLSPEDRLLASIDLGSNNLDQTKLRYNFNSDTLRFEFAINDSWNRESIATGAKIDMRDILKAVAEGDVRYRQVAITGVFPMTDSYGNTHLTKVIEATYTAATVRQINFSNFSFRNVYAVADEIYVHPDFW